MALMLLRREALPGAVGSPPAVARRLAEIFRALLDRLDGHRRALLAVAALSGLAAFVLGGGNRFTRGPLFLYIPEVDLVPPLGRAAWQQAFAIHQQSPLYALCGGYQVGGMESLTVYQMLYFWEWGRVASLVLLGALLVPLATLALRRAIARGGRADILALLGAGAFALAYLVLRWFSDHAGLFATINLGQHRHALDVMFASVALAMLVAAVVSPGRGGSVPARAAWAVAIALDIAFGALLEAMDAGVLWRSFPFYADGFLPGPDRLFAFAPAWHNFFENGYLIQACHRVLAFALWIASFVALLAAWGRGRRCQRSALLFVLLTVAGALGAATVMLAEPVALSVVHQVVAVLVLAGALIPEARDTPRPAAAAAPQLRVA